MLSTRVATPTAAPRAPRAFAPLGRAACPARVVLRRVAPEEKSEKSGADFTPDKKEFEMPRTGAGVESETKKASNMEAGGAPEGDRAIAGQAYQLGGSPKTPEERFGSKEAAEKAQEEYKDTSRKSERQHGDDQGNYAEGGA